MRTFATTLAVLVLGAGAFRAPASAAPKAGAGSLEPLGWQLVAEPGAAPRVVPAALAGSDWSDVGGGVSGSVQAIAVAPDGVVYVGGTFLQAGGVPAQYIARWDGTAWTSLGSANDWVFSLLLRDDGTLYAGGRFTQIGGVSATRIAYYNPDLQTWHAVGVGFNNPVQSIAEGPDGCLYAAGGFRIVGDNAGQNVARTCDGETWEYVGGGTDNTVNHIVFHDGMLYAGGSFGTAGGVSTRQIARFDLTAGQWGPLGEGVTQVGGGPTVYALAFDSEDKLYVGGAFNEVGGVAAANLARWDGASWSAVGGGVSGTTGGSTAVLALGFDGGDNLYVAGSFTEAGSVTVNSVARWDGEAWAGLGSGVGNGSVNTFAIAFPYLYAGGGFSDMDGDPELDYLAKWEGVILTPAEAPVVPTGAAYLAPAFPNPFRAEATLTFALPRAQAVRLELFDVLARSVAVLYDGTPGAGQPVAVRVDGRGLPAGVYAARLVGDGVRLTRRLTLVR